MRGPTAPGAGPPSSFGAVLAEFGVEETTLGAAERARLDEDGYLVVPGALRPAELAAIRSRVDELIVAEGERAGLEAHQEAGTDRLANLVDKGPVFDACWTHPVQLAAVAHVLFRPLSLGAPGGAGSGDPGPRERDGPADADGFKLSSLNARSARPGQGLQALHADWPVAVPPGAYEACNSIWLLDDFREDNGATRVVPGSHRSGALPAERLADPMAPHPDEVLLVAPAGTCVVFNSHLWHGGTENRTAEPRRAIHGFFVRRPHPQQTSQRRFLRAETRARLSSAERILLDVEVG